MRSWQQLVIFLCVISLVMGGVHYYLFSRLARAPEIELLRRFGAWVFGLSALLMPVGVVLSQRLPREVGGWVAFATYSWMGLIIFLFFGTLFSELPRGVYGLLSATNVVPTDPSRRTFLSRTLLGFVAAYAVGMGGFGLAQVLAAVQVKRVKVALAKLPASMSGFKIVQLTDVHIGPTIDGRWLAEVVRQVNELEPDLVAITGDLVDGSVAELAQHVAPLAELKAKHGVFFVTGNHEYYSGVDAWLAEIDRLGIKALRNEHVLIEQGDARFALAGVDDYKAHQFGNGHGADLDKALAGIDPTLATVLLAHQPKQAPEAAKRGVGLQLSGHTHGGQFFPWGYFVKLEQGFVAGLERLGATQLYTSCGTGYWGPPMRVGAPAEITLVELTHEPIG